MQMTFRWFGHDKDTVTLDQIKQIPGVVGVVPALHDLPAGEAWTMDRVQAMYDEITVAAGDAGLGVLYGRLQRGNELPIQPGRVLACGIDHRDPQHIVPGVSHLVAVAS